jgi:hypothetical protein
MERQECLQWAARLDVAIDACRASDGDRAYAAVVDWLDAYAPNWKEDSYDEFMCGGQLRYRSLPEELSLREWAAVAPCYYEVYDTVITVENQLESHLRTRAYGGSSYERPHVAPLLLLLQVQGLLRCGETNSLPVGTELVRRDHPDQRWRIARLVDQPFYRWSRYRITRRGYYLKQIGGPRRSYIFDRRTVWPEGNWRAVALPACAKLE